MSYVNRQHFILIFPNCEKSCLPLSHKNKYLVLKIYIYITSLTKSQIKLYFENINTNPSIALGQIHKRALTMKLKDLLKAYFSLLPFHPCITLSWFSALKYNPSTYQHVDTYHDLFYKYDIWVLTQLHCFSFGMWYKYHSFKNVASLVLSVCNKTLGSYTLFIFFTADHAFSFSWNHSMDFW